MASGSTNGISTEFWPMPTGPADDGMDNRWTTGLLPTVCIDGLYEWVKQPLSKAFQAELAKVLWGRKSWLLPTPVSDVYWGTKGDLAHLRRNAADLVDRIDSSQFLTAWTEFLTRLSLERRAAGLRSRAAARWSEGEFEPTIIHGRLSERWTEDLWSIASDEKSLEQIETEIKIAEWAESLTGQLYDFSQLREALVCFVEALTWAIETLFDAPPPPQFDCPGTFLRQRSFFKVHGMGRPPRSFGWAC